MSMISRVMIGQKCKNLERSMIIKKTSGRIVANVNAWKNVMANRNKYNIA